MARVHYRLILDEQAWDDLQCECPLLFNECRPAPSCGAHASLMQETAVHHAVVFSSDHTFLMVLQHSYPYKRQKVGITALVLHHPRALAHLRHFLHSFRTTCASQACGMETIAATTTDPAQTASHHSEATTAAKKPTFVDLRNGVGMADLVGLLREFQFKLQ